MQIFSGMPDISIVLPIYNEEPNLEPLVQEIVAALEPLGKNFEIVAVNDGSSDRSGALLEEMARRIPSLKPVHFRRNCGQAAAFDAGFRAAEGDIVVTLDADLQNDPRDIPAMIVKLNQGYDLISGWRKNRHDGLFIRKVPSWIANWIIRKVTKTKIHDLGCSLKVYRKQIVDEIRLYGEMHRFVGPLAESVGARVGEHVVNHRPRIAGQSKYGLARTVKVLLDLLTVWFMRSYQTKPIYVFGGSGFAMLGLSFCTLMITTYEKFILEVQVHRNPMFLISILFTLVGLQFIGLGLISEIMIRIYFESQDRKGYMVMEPKEVALRYRVV